MTTAQDAAVLYFALHGTDAPLTCRHVFGDDGECDYPERDEDFIRCGKTIAGLGISDGAPLCADHCRSEGGHLLSEDVLAELWVVKRTLDGLREDRTPLNNLEAFALKVSGHYTRDTEPAPPPSTKREVELKLRGIR